jgi:hypothetical protein
MDQLTEQLFAGHTSPMSTAYSHGAATMIVHASLAACSVYACTCIIKAINMSLLNALPVTNSDSEGGTATGDIDSDAIPAEAASLAAT